MDIRLATSVATCALMSATAALASGPLPPFSFVDEDGDRNISRSEARAEHALAAQFDQLDSDGNGRLNRLEYLRANKRHNGPHNAGLLDGDHAAAPVLTGNRLP